MKFLSWQKKYIGESLIESLADTSLNQNRFIDLNPSNVYPRGVIRLCVNL